MVLTVRRVALSLALCAAMATPAYADAETDKVAAAALADAALVQLQRGDTRSALDLFSRASALVPAATFALYEARCLVALDRLDEADLAYSRASAFDEGPTATAAQKQAIAEARTERAALRKKREAKARPIEPAPRAPDPPPALVVAPTPSAPPPPPETVASGPSRAAVVALGVGGAGVAFGVVSGLVMISKKHELDDACPTGRCSPSSSDQLDAYRSARTVSMVGWGVGLVGLGVGAGLWIAGPRATSTTSMVVVVGPSSAALRGEFLSIGDFGCALKRTP